MTKTLAYVRSLLLKHGITETDLRRAGIGSVTARKLLGNAKYPGEVTVDVLERALVLVKRELTSRRVK